MVKGAFAVKLAASGAAIGAAILAGTAQAGFVTTPATLTQPGPGCSQAASSQVCGNLFAAGASLVPGGAATSRTVTLTYSGSAASGAAGLYLQGFQTRTAASAPTCTAIDPAAKLDLTVAENGRTLYEGTLSDFAAIHSDPAGRLVLAGATGRDDHFNPGDRVAVTLSIALDRSAGNAYMGCASTTDFVWFAEL
jgi:hypothetical protein